ncbi:hypothetical protein HY479_02470 [Candidatus Uhrbacteria bacterium]|nr:hypothetical protein [Candidatus Uhrbacteria bacterium]
MPFISVVPNIRTPLGVDCFDYRIEDGADVRIGDVIPVTFRGRKTAALVTSVHPESAFAEKAKTLSIGQPSVRLPPTVVPLLQRAALRTFSSRPTVLHSWLRTAPARAGTVTIPSVQRQEPTSSGDRAEFAVHRFERLVQHARASRGRVLVLTPWQRRADALARALSSGVLHAEIPMGRAWRSWTEFIARPDGMLVATRLGAWLACAADVVIMDEPENDDWKEDERSPRLDARWLIAAANLYRPALRVIRIGTTPLLADTPDLGAITVPDVRADVTAVTWDRRGVSSIEGLQDRTLELIGEAAGRQPVVILHPIRGDRPRLRCRNCGWQAACPNCGFTLSQVGNSGQCTRCGTRGDLPLQCPSCGGAEFSGGRVGRDRLATLVRGRFGSHVEVRDLSDWNALAVPRGALIVVTDLTLIGGICEDIRRKERLLIAWRRLAASAVSANGRLVAQGPEDTLAEAMGWLTAAGVRACWKSEWKDRQTFGYPPAGRRIKLICPGTESMNEPLVKQLRDEAPQGWELSGPFPVAFRPRTRGDRSIIHLHPPDTATEADTQSFLEPFAKDVIIDLDPIAFFS